MRLTESCPRMATIKKLKYLKRRAQMMSETTRPWNLRKNEKLNRADDRAWRKAFSLPCWGKTFLVRLEDTREQAKCLFTRLSLAFFPFFSPANEANKEKYCMCSTWSNLWRTALNAFIRLLRFALSLSLHPRPSWLKTSWERQKTDIKILPQSLNALQRFNG